MGTGALYFLNIGCQPAKFYLSIEISIMALSIDNIARDAACCRRTHRPDSVALMVLDCWINEGSTANRGKYSNTHEEVPFIKILIHRSIHLARIVGSMVLMTKYL
jgi:hypothetical protein